MAGPKVVLLDEPSTGIDPRSRKQLFKHLRGMREQTVVLITHRVDEAEDICDKVAVMINGQFKAFGTPSYLKNQLGQGYILRIELASELKRDFVD